MKILLVLLSCFAALSAFAQRKDDWPLSKDITLVYITDETIREVGSFPFNRKVYGEFIDAVYTNYKPAAVNINFYIVDYNADLPKGDAALADAAKDKDDLFFAAIVGDAVQNEPDEKSAWLVMPSRSSRTSEGAFFPLPTILNNGARTAFTNAYLNEQGYYGAYPTIISVDGLPYPSMPLALAAAYHDLPDTEQGDFVQAILQGMEISPNGEFKIDYDHRFTALPMHEIIRGEANPRLVDGRIIIFGANFSGGGDQLPIGRNYLIPGSEVVANATQTLLDMFTAQKAE